MSETAEKPARKKRAVKKKVERKVSPKGSWYYHPKLGGKVFMPDDEPPGPEWTDNWKDL